ncbi:hypothetical protein ACFYY8_40680 [Streptosporangium sp. NPDC001559]|uniref:hypothetical protein n=1 Tax=Streptosporangium sp. NPDC001559 TaxID=3366187 RepID=UPI0036EB6016
MAEASSRFSFARLDTNLIAPPVYMSAGIDGSLTIVARGDHIPLRYRRAMHAFRFAQYWKLGFLDRNLVGIDEYAAEVAGAPPGREYHTMVLDRASGYAAAYVYMTLPDPAASGVPFTLEKEYDVTVGETVAKGMGRDRTWEAKRLVRRIGIPWSDLARNAPWWALLGLSFLTVRLWENGELESFVADGAREGSPQMFEHLGFAVDCSEERPRSENASGPYGPMWRQERIPVAYSCMTYRDHESHLRRVETLLKGNRGMSVRKQLSAWRQDD